MLAQHSLLLLLLIAQVNGRAVSRACNGTVLYVHIYAHLHTRTPAHVHTVQATKVPLSDGCVNALQTCWDVP